LSSTSEFDKEVEKHEPPAKTEKPRESEIMRESEK
jgi:hypothetical protein